VNLADEETYLAFHQNPGEIKSLLEQHKPKSVFIDEIQRLPSLTNSLQAILDSKAAGKLKFYLSGSSARKLRRGKANLLPGRIHDFQISGFCAEELGFKLDAKLAMSLGTLPDPYLNKNLADAEKGLRSYVATYLREEIQAEALTRNLEGFSRFLSAVAENYGLVLDMSKLSKRARVGRVAAIRFLEILEDTLLGMRLESFGRELDINVVKHPKIFFFDPGIVNGLLGNFVVSTDRSGRLFEQLVYSQLKNTLYSKDLSHELFFFRTHSGLEVDFVLKVAGQLFAIECKSGPVTEGDAQALTQFAEYFPQATLLLVSPKEEKKRYGKVSVLGLNQMLAEVFPR